ncbi:MAG TPA: FHA domain-containing protein [Thermoanaerobaculia bacterium]|nr:FHA domain-containing protein [Thermoanaerobaculia bacterium]
MPVRVGEFVFDRERRELRRGSQQVHLTPKAFQLLSMLIDARPRAIAQETLHDALWPETHVSEGSLHNLIHELRRRLDDTNHEVIKTSYGYGFSFAAEALDDRLTPAPCVITIGDADFILLEGENVIGRDWNATVRIDAPSISRHHARIRVTGGHATIEDLGSKNGTTVGGRRLRTAHELHDGEQILFGTVAAKFRILPVKGPTESASR